MTRICAWCNEVIPEKPGATPGGGVTHGICRACLVVAFAEVAAEVARENLP